MRFATLNGRLQLVTEAGLVDVATESGGALPDTAAAALDRFDEVTSWVRTLRGQPRAAPFNVEELEAPSPAPRQVFAIGLNYAPHAEESGFAVPAYPYVFTKTAASLTGPFGELRLPSDTVDWEVEVVVVIGREAREVPEDKAWSFVAGLTLGQDYSDREVQSRLGPNSQPTLGKSRDGFAPTGPFLVTPDEFADPDDIELATIVNGEDRQRSRTSRLVFGIPALIAYLSATLPMYPGDLIFTGTPEGVGFGRTPPLYLRPGDVIESWAEGLGSMRQVAIRA